MVSDLQDRAYALTDSGSSHSQHTEDQTRAALIIFVDVSIAPQAKTGQREILTVYDYQAAWHARYFEVLPP